MTYIENIFICMVSPLLVAALCMGRRQLRFFLFCIAGMGVCLLSAYINTFLAAVCQADALAATAEIAPVVEEMMKLLPLVFYLLVFEPEGDKIKPAAHDQAAEDVHGSRAEAPEKDKGKAIRSVLNEIAHVFKGGEGEGHGDGGSLDFIPLRLEHQKIEHQRQQLHDLLHHRRDLRRGGKGIRLTHRRKEGIDIG